MAKNNTQKILIIFSLLLLGTISSFIIWFFVFLPVRLVKPIEFQPIAISDRDFYSAQKKMNDFFKTHLSINLTREEVCVILKETLQENLGLEISDIYIQYNGNTVSVLIKSKISGIPSIGFVSFIFKRGETEYATTYISAELSIHEGGFNYFIQDFRIGRVQIPDLFISRFIEGNRTLKGIYLTKLEIQGGSLHLERR
jgi:hypothetical protein